MYYETEYYPEHDIWVGEDPIEVNLEDCIVVNNTFSHAFGTEYLPDEIEDLEWSVIVSKLNPQWMKKYSVSQLEIMINQDELFFQAERKILATFMRD